MYKRQDFFYTCPDFKKYYFNAKRIFLFLFLLVYLYRTLNAIFDLCYYKLFYFVIRT